MSRCSTTRRSSSRSASSSTTRRATPGRRPSPARCRRRPPAGPAPPTTYSPAMEMHLRVLDFGTDKYGLNAWIFDSTNDSTTDYDRVLFSRTKNGADTVGDLAKGEWADVKVTDRSGDALDGKTAGFLSRSSGSPATSRRSACSTPPSRARSRHGRPGPASPASPATSRTTSRRPSRPRRPPTSRPRGRRSSRGHLRPAGPLLVDGHWPMLRYVVDTYKPDLAARRHARRPTSSSTSSSAWSRPKLPNGAGEPRL